MYNNINCEKGVYVMTKRMKRKFDKEFKTEICELVLKQDIPIADIGKNYGISVQVIYRWIDEYKTYGKDAFVGSGNLHTEDARLKELEKELEEAKMEIEILKKTAKYFLEKPKKE